MRGRVGCFMTPITGAGSGSECCSFWQNMGLGFGPSGTISVRVVHGLQNLWGSLRAEWSCPQCLHWWSWHCRLWPSSSSRWPVSLWAAATSHSFGRLNENAPWCSKVLIWIFIKLQLCIFYLSLIHLASWDITVLHSNYCENICVLILWGLLSLSRISCSYVLCKQNKTADALPENEAYSHFILQTVKYFWDADS